MCRKLRYPSRHVATIGKRNGQILDYVYSLQRVVALDEIAEHLEVKRARSIKDRNIKLLLEEGLLQERDGGYVTPEDIEIRLARFLKESGHDEAEKLQRQRIERDREGFRTRNESPTTQRVHPVARSCYFETVSHTTPTRSARTIAR